MRSENILQNKQIFIVQFCLALFVVLMFLETFSFSLVIPAVVIFCTIVFVIFQYPPIIIYAFIFSFFVGIVFFRFFNLGISPSELILPFVIIGFIGQVVQQRKMSVLDKDFKLISYGFLSIIFTLIASLIVNLNTLTPWFITNGFLVILKFIEYYLVFFLITCICDSKQRVNNLIYALLIFSGLQFPIVIFQNFSNSMGGEEISRNILGTMSYHHGMIGTYMLIPLGLSLGLLLKAKTFSTKICHLTTAAIFLLQIIFSSARSALIGAIGAISLFFTIKFRLSFKYLCSLIILILLCSLIYLFTPVKTLVNATINANTSIGFDISSLSRLYIWQGGINFFLDSELKTKIFGVGPGAYPVITYKGVIENGLRHAFGGHNNFLTVTCETGLFGIFLFLIFWIIVLKVLYTKRREPLAKTYFYVTISMLISGLTQETFWASTAFFNLWTLYFIGLAIVLKSASYNGETNGV